MSNVFGSRLRQLRKDKRMTMKEFGAFFGLAESTISGYETGIRNPDMDTIRKFAAYFDVTTDLLIGVEDKMPIDKPIKKSDNSTYTTQNGSGYIEGLMGELLDPGEMVFVPIVADVSCGDPLYTEDEVLGYLPVAAIMYHIADKNDYFAVRAKGDSMKEAGINDGSFVLIRKQSTADNGDIVAVCVKNEKATIKRIHFDGEMVVLSPANADYGPQIYPVQDIRVVGKAVLNIVTKAL
jgi:SOS-response transcriptional repressor LexA